MTDREKLTQLIYDNPEQYLSEGTCREIADHLLANGVTLQKWIPVSERLPDTSGDYLTRCHHYRNGDWSEVVPFDVDKNYFADLDGYYYPFVTHWMPLPEPPKEENR